MFCPTSHFYVVKPKGVKESVMCYIPRDHEDCLEYLKKDAIHIDWYINGCMCETLETGSWTKFGCFYSDRDTTSVPNKTFALKQAGKHKSWGEIKEEQGIPNKPLMTLKEAVEPQGWKRINTQPKERK